MRCSRVFSSELDQAMSTSRDHKLIEDLTLEFSDLTYKRKSSPVGKTFKSALQAYAWLLPVKLVKWGSCVEDPRKVFVLSCKCSYLRPQRIIRIIPIYLKH